MLRHTGEKRTHRHNIRLAALLCITAGFVNISGLLGFMVLTTNVTGHAALFAEKLSQGNFRGAITVGIWMLAFLSGAFTSALCIRLTGRNVRNAHTIPLIIEIAILFLVGTLGHSYDHSPAMTEYFAGSLLFAMGLQNAMVTMISGSVVRTTHLTGMFTDLGIDLSAVIYEKKQTDLTRRRISLRLVIIGCFLLGGIVGGYLFNLFSYHTLYFAVGLLLIALFYDFFRFKALKMIHQMRS